MRITVLFIFFLFFLTIQNINAQGRVVSKISFSQIDSLKNLLKDHLILDSVRVDLQNQLGFEYWIIDPNESERFGLQSIELAKGINYSKGEAMANRVVGVAHWVRSNYELSYFYLFKANNLYDAISDTLGIANTILNLGMVYQDQADYEKAEDHYNRAISIFINLDRKDRVATTQTKWGSMLVSTGNLDQAYELLTTALKTHESNDFLYGVAEVNNILGELFVKKEEYDTALSYLFQSVEAGTKRSDHVGIADNFQQIGEVYIMKNELDQAESYLRKGQVMAEDFHLKTIQKNIYFSFKILYQRRGQFKKALNYFDEYAAISDSIFNEEKANQIATVQAQYEFTQKEKELELVNQEVVLLMQEKRANNYLKIVFVLMVLLLCSLVWGVIRKKNTEIISSEKALIEAKHTTKELEGEILAKENKLTSYTLNFIQKNELFQQVKESLDGLKKESNLSQKKKLESLSRLIDSAVRIDEDWEGFRKYFEATHKGLISVIKQKYPQLTQNDLRLLALVRINLSSKEIGSMLGITAESVKTARYRLRKKMQLKSKENLFDFLIRLEKY